MTGERIAWAVLAAVLGEVLLSVGQPSVYLPVFALQVASSAALAALVTAAAAGAAKTLEARRGILAGLRIASTGPGKNGAVRRYVAGFLREHPGAELTVHEGEGAPDRKDGTP